MADAADGDIRVGIIGGSGLGALLGDGEAEVVRHEREALETPFGLPSDAILETRWDGLPVFLLSRHGPGHVFNPSMVPFRANVFALKRLGVTHLIASGAVGSLREEMRPRDLVVADQVIDKTYRRAGTFFESAAVHVELAEPFCPVLRQILVEAGRSVAEEAKAAGAESAFEAHDSGTYVCMEGPAFSTRAESLMHRLWGGDLIGMTAMPEAKLAREAEISYALVALVTDYDCWRQRPVVTTAAAAAAAASSTAASSPSAAALAAASGATGAPAAAPAPDELLKEIIGNLRAASANAMKVVRRAVSLLAERRSSLPPSPAHRALELAIWSEKGRIPPEEVKRLSPLWIKYFGGSPA